MKIVLVTHYYSGHMGGIEIVAGELARRLSPSVDVTWIASDGDAATTGLPAHVRPVPMRTFNFIERITGLPFPIWSPGSLRQLWKAARNADVVHLHDFAYLGNWIAFMAANRHGVPVLITQHIGLIPYRSAILRAIQEVLHFTAGKSLLGRATLVVFVSDVVMDYYRTFVSFRKPPRRLSNGVDSNTFTVVNSVSRISARENLALDPARPVLLFVGRFVEKKGLRIIAKLANLLPDAQWLLAGRGPINPQEWNATNVKVVQGRRQAALVPLYHAADLLVLPSIGEGLPLVVQEAMSCGIPALVGEDTARAVGAPPGLCAGCRVGDEDDAERWAAEIRSLLQRSAPTPSEIAAFARSQWSWDECARAYLDIYRQLTRGPGT